MFLIVDQPLGVVLDAPVHHGAGALAGLCSIQPKIFCFANHACVNAKLGVAIVEDNAIGAFAFFAFLRTIKHILRHHVSVLHLLLGRTPFADNMARAGNECMSVDS